MFRKVKKRHSSSSSQSSEISTKSKVHLRRCISFWRFYPLSAPLVRNCVSLPLEKSVDSSLGGLSRSSTVASLDTDSTKSCGQSLLPALPFHVFPSRVSMPQPFPHRRQQRFWNVCRVPRQVCGSHREVAVQHEQGPAGAPGAHHLHWRRSGEEEREEELEVVKLKRNVEKCSCVLTARWEASLRAGGQGDDSRSVQVWSQSGLAGPVCE